MNKYTIFWQEGKSEVITGNSIPDAFRRTGYGLTAQRRVIFVMSGDVSDSYNFNKSSKTWEINT